MRPCTTFFVQLLGGSEVTLGVLEVTESVDQAAWPQLVFYSMQRGHFWNSKLGIEELGKALTGPSAETRDQD